MTKDRKVQKSLLKFHSMSDADRLQLLKKMDLALDPSTTECNQPAEVFSRLVIVSLFS